MQNIDRSMQSLKSFWSKLIYGRRVRQAQGQKGHLQNSAHTDQKRYIKIALVSQQVLKNGQNTTSDISVNGKKNGLMLLCIFTSHFSPLLCTITFHSCFGLSLQWIFTILLRGQGPDDSAWFHSIHWIGVVVFYTCCATNYKTKNKIHQGSLRLLCSCV